MRLAVHIVAVMVVVWAVHAAPLAAQAQQPAKVARIGVLESSSPSAFPDRLEAIRMGLRELGYVEGQSIVFEYRWAHGNLAELPELAAELVRRKVDVIVAGTTPAAMAAKDATRTIPIVFAVPADPVGVRLVASLARPGGNLTGLTTINIEAASKRLEILKELSGGKVSRAAALFNPADASNVLFVRAAQDAARVLGMTLRPFEVTSAEDFEAAFSAMAAARIDALLVAAGALTDSHARRIAELAARARVPAVYGARGFVEAGGLASYSANFSDNYRRAATYVDKILKGAKPGELPVEQASTFELVINHATAKALGLTVSPSLLMRADRVIE